MVSTFLVIGPLHCVPIRSKNRAHPCHAPITLHNGSFWTKNAKHIDIFCDFWIIIKLKFTESPAEIWKIIFNNPEIAINFAPFWKKWAHCAMILRYTPLMLKTIKFRSKQLYPSFVDIWRKKKLNSHRVERGNDIFKKK